MYAMRLVVAVRAAIWIRADKSVKSRRGRLLQSAWAAPVDLVAVQRTLRLMGVRCDVPGHCSANRSISAAAL